MIKKNISDRYRGKFSATVAESYCYPVLDIPPAAQAQARSFSGGRLHLLNYGGRDIIRIEVISGVKSRIRFHSDSSMQASPLIQQFYLSTAAPARAVVTLHMRKDALCLKPRRARKGEAILAQAGSPLIYGVNGYYGLWEDLMIEWHGCADWHWLGERSASLEDGSFKASFEISLDARPLVLLLRPRYYGQHMGYRFYTPWARRPNPKGVSGWCSWEAYHAGVTGENLAGAAGAMSGLSAYGLEYIQLDDGYEQSVIPPAKEGKIFEAWLTPTGKFPGGHERIVESILSRGLVPGIWTNTVVTNEEAADSGLCMTENGKAFRGDWIQFILNCTEKALTEHVLPYYRGLRAYGYAYFKTDSIRHLFFDGLQECVRRGLLTDEEADSRFRGFLQCARRGMGDDAYFLSCWGVLTQAVGLADACRVATDADPTWGRVQMQVAETARWFFAQRILFTLDPDHICARTELEWARMLLSFVSLTGGVYMLSDPLECYDGERIRIIQKTLPALEVYAGETGFVDYTSPAFCWPANSGLSPEELSDALFDRGQNTFGTFWAAHFRKGDRRWTVVMRTALVPLAEEDIPLEAVGLEPGGEYAVYDFWEERFLGIANKTVKLRALPIGHVQVCALTPLAESAPTLIGSNRHVSMDAVSVSACTAGEGILSLRLRGVPGESFEYCVYSKAECTVLSQRPCSVRREGALYRLTVAFAEGEAEVVLRRN